MFVYISKTYKRKLVHLLILKIYYKLCAWLFLKNDVYAKYINLEKSGLKKIQKKEEKHWLAMLCEQTEERGNFIIFTSLAAVYAFNCRSYIPNYRRVSFLRKKKCWKITDEVCRWHISQLRVTKVNIFFTLVSFTTSSRLIHGIYPNAVPATNLGYITRSALDMKVSECNSCDVEIRFRK